MFSNFISSIKIVSRFDIFNKKKNVSVGNFTVIAYFNIGMAS